VRIAHFVFAYGALAGEGAGATRFLDIQGRDGAEHRLYVVCLGAGLSLRSPLTEGESISRLEKVSQYPDRDRRLAEVPFPFVVRTAFNRPAEAGLA